MSNCKNQRFEQILQRLDTLYSAGDLYRRSPTRFPIPGLDDKSWERFTSLVSFFRAYYSNANRWKVVPFLIGPYDGRNWWGIITFIRKDVFYGNIDEALTILIHEAQHDWIQFGADIPHSKPGYKWDELIGDGISACVCALRVQAEHKT